MWALLSHPGHAEGFLPLGEAYSPLRLLVEQLARRPYADDVYACASMATFALTTAPTYGESPGRDRVGIEFDPATGLFAVGYEEWVSPAANPPRRSASMRTRDRPGAIEAIDSLALRLLLADRARAGPGDGPPG